MNATLRHGVAALALAVATASAGCATKPPAAKEKPVDVTVTTPVASDALIDYQDYTGRLETIEMVEVRARVSGYLDKSYLEGRVESDHAGGPAAKKGEPAVIKEGSLVKKGDVLFVIDQRPFRAALAASKAQLSLQEANLSLARVTYNRSRSASGAGGGAVSPLELDQNRSSVEQSMANLELAKANEDTARINLDYTEVRAPISGRVSRRMVDERNVVVADTTILTTILAEERLYANFDVDERAYLDLLEHAKPGDSSLLSGARLPVMMRLANEEDFKRSGVVDFVDNRVNANTGTIRMRGVFDNAKGILKAGMFVRIRLPISKQYSGLLVPDVALQSDQGKKYVYVVKTATSTREDGTEEKKDVIEYRPVEVGQVIEGLRVIKPAVKDKDGKILTGLEPKERVVIVGMQRVRARSEVKAESKAPPPPPKSPLARLFRKPEAQGLAAHEGPAD